MTEADLRSEAWLTPRLADLHPGSVVVGEEAVSNDETILERLSEDGSVWVIDPVDGTANFAKGLPTFAIIVARVQSGETVQGWIYEPASGRLAVSELGAGVRVDGRPPPRQVRAGQGARFSGYAPRRMRVKIEKHADRFADVTPSSSAGYEYLELLSGNTDFTAYSRLKPWDHAAGVMMVREAGGVSQLWNEDNYSPRLLEGHLLSTIQADIWPDLRDILIGPVAPA